VILLAILRKVKKKIKDAVSKKKKIVSAKKISPRRAKKEISLATVKEIPGMHELVAQRIKFFTPQSPAAPRMLEELPGSFGQDKIILQVRDPRWLHTYWEVTGASFERLQHQLGQAFYSAKRILRVYDVTDLIFKGNNAHRFFDIEVGSQANNWYIDTNGPGRSWCVDYGLLLPDGRFIMIVRSNIVQTPLDGPSWITDEEWMIPEDMFARLYGMGFGFGKSSPVGKAWKERLLSSPGIASMASPVRKAKERKFWLMVNTELIVYGATEPDAKVTIQGKPLKLRPDGTFSLRFALPDGRQVIPVEATSADELETRTITPIVTKETKSHSNLRERAQA